MSKLASVVKDDLVFDFGKRAERTEPRITVESRNKETAWTPSPASAISVAALGSIFLLDGARNPAADQYRTIRTKLLHDEKKPHLLLVSSASSGDGKTTTSINLAISLALKPDERIVLVDTDLRRSAIAAALGVNESPGLSDVLGGSHKLWDALRPVKEFPNLFVLPAGACDHDSPAELLDSERWRSLLEELKDKFSRVVFDAPPMAMGADYDLLQLASDGVMLVIRPGHTEAVAFRKAMSTVAKDKLVGVVLNAVEDWWGWKSPTYGYYPKHSAKKTD